MMPTTVNVLPKEVLAQCFTLLPVQDFLQCVPLVCKQWMEVAKLVVASDNSRNNECDSCFCTVSMGFHALVVSNSLRLTRWLVSVFKFEEKRIYNAFLEKCELGQIESVKFLAQQCNMDRWCAIDDVFEIACVHGRLNILQWLHEHFREAVTALDKKHAFFSCLENSHSDVVKWLVPTYNIVARDVIYYPHERSSRVLNEILCQNRALADYLASFMDLHEHKNSIRPHDAFVNAAHDGDLGTLRWLHGIFHFTARDFTELEITQGFRAACCKGHLEVLQWMHNECHIESVHVREHRNDAFRVACERGHLEIAQWIDDNFDLYCEESLYDNIDGTLGHTQRSRHYADTNNELDAELLEREFHSHILNAFVLACKRGHIHVATWLNRTFTINTASFANTSRGPFYWACRSGHTEMAKWLFTEHNMKSEQPIAGQLLVYTLMGKHYDTAQWMLSALDWNVNNTPLMIMTDMVFTSFHDVFCKVLEDSPALAATLCETLDLPSRPTVIRSVDALFRFCMRNDTSSLAFLHKNFTIVRENALRCICLTSRRGHVEAFRWLVITFGLTADDMAANDHQTFVDACVCGRLGIVRWLTKFYNPFVEHKDHHPALAAAFTASIVHDRKKIQSYLLSTFHITKETLRLADTHPLHYICCSSAPDTEQAVIAKAKWLKRRFLLDKDDLSLGSAGDIVVEVVGNDTLEILKWLVTEFDITAFDIIHKCAFNPELGNDPSESWRWLHGHLLLPLLC